VPKYVPDGVVEGRVDAHSFIVRIRKAGPSYIITIPLGIVEALNINKGDLVEVFVRKIDEGYAMREYGYVPRIRRSLHVKCPICGEVGLVSIQFRRFELRVRHSNNVIHYIPPVIYPEFYIEMYARLIELGRIPVEYKDRVVEIMNKLTRKLSGEVVK